MSKKEVYWIHRDYGNRSLNEIAKCVTEYQTGWFLTNGYEVKYSEHPVGPNILQFDIGTVHISPTDSFLVTDVHRLNSIFNYNLYFLENNSEPLDVPIEHFGTFDCLVSLAAGSKVVDEPKQLGLKGNHYVIDISPTAIAESSKIYKSVSKYTQLDIFDQEAVKKFLATCEGTKGFFSINNCFIYIVNSLIYDVKLRLEMQNRFIKTLAEDKIEWYVRLDSADTFADYNCVRAKDIQNKILDQRFNIFPWI